MAEQIIKEINKYETYSFDKENNRVVNLNTNENTNIDEFMEIQYLLDKNRIKHEFQANFEIKIIK